MMPKNGRRDGKQSLNMQLPPVDIQIISTRNRKNGKQPNGQWEKHLNGLVWLIYNRKASNGIGRFLHQIPRGRGKDNELIDKSKIINLITIDTL